MASSRNLDKAERVIGEMPVGYWIDVRALAKNAGLGVREMSRFPIRARKAGRLDYRTAIGHSIRISLWKRLA